MQTLMPFFETPEEALKASVQALGGAKSIASEMWPDKTMENAREYLLNCLNPDRAEKLSYSQIIYIFRKAKEAGFHAGFEWWSRECEYESQPISRAEQRDKLLNVIDQATTTLNQALSVLAKLKA